MGGWACSEPNQGSAFYGPGRVPCLGGGRVRGSEHTFPPLGVYFGGLVRKARSGSRIHSLAPPARGKVITLGAIEGPHRLACEDARDFIRGRLRRLLSSPSSGAGVKNVGGCSPRTSKLEYPPTIPPPGRGVGGYKSTQRQAGVIQNPPGQRGLSRSTKWSHVSRVTTSLQGGGCQVGRGPDPPPWEAPHPRRGPPATPRPLRRAAQRAVRGGADRGAAGGRRAAGLHRGRGRRRGRGPGRDGNGRAVGVEGSSPPQPCWV